MDGESLEDRNSQDDDGLINNDQGSEPCERKIPLAMTHEATIRVLAVKKPDIFIDLTGKLLVREACKKEHYLRIYNEITSADANGVHRAFLTQSLSDDPDAKNNLLRNQANYLTDLTRELNKYGLTDEAKKIQDRYYQGEMKDFILRSLVFDWYNNLAKKSDDVFPKDKKWTTRMARGDQAERAKEVARDKHGMSGSLEYIWAAADAYNEERDLEKFEQSIRKAAEARSTCLGYEFEGPELAFLGSESERVFKVIIPLVNQEIANREAAKKRAA